MCYIQLSPLLTNAVDSCVQLHEEVSQLRDREMSLRRSGESLCNILEKISGQPLSGELPEMFRGKKKSKSPTRPEVNSFTYLLSLFYI